MAQILVGCAGWSYPDWKGVFYPKSLPSNQFLSYYAKFFNFVEINSSFYSIPTREKLLSWNEETPDEFQFSIKMWQKITHAIHHPDLEMRIQQFFAQLSYLNPKIARILVQFPPSFKYNNKNYYKLHKLCNFIPKSYQFALEFRHNSWFESSSYDDLPLTFPSNLSFVTTYMDGLEPYFPHNQTRFYLRMIGDRTLTRFSHIQREQQTTIGMALSQIHQIQQKNNKINITQFLIIFNNHFRGFSPQDVNEFKAKLGLPWKSFQKNRSLTDYFQ